MRAWYVTHGMGSLAANRSSVAVGLWCALQRRDYVLACTQAISGLVQRTIPSLPARVQLLEREHIVVLQGQRPSGLRRGSSTYLRGCWAK